MAVQALKKDRKTVKRKSTAAKAPKQHSYAWEGADKKGQRVKGEMTGETPAIVKAQLRKQGISPIKVTKKSVPLFGGSKGKPVEPKDIAMFSRQIATMMKAGVPLVQSFDIIGRGHEKPSVQELLLSVKADIESGNTMADSLRKNPKYFDDLFCDLVDAGEQSGSLEGMLDRIATYKEKTEALKSKIKKALSYPIAVIVVAVIVTSILLVKVVPQFQDIFKGFGADLPAFTIFVIGISEFMQEFWWMFLIGIVAFIAIYKRVYQSSKKVRDRQDKALLKFPVIGVILHKAAVARFARTLATTFAAGVPLVEALDSAAGASGNALYRDAIIKIRDDVTTGMQMNLSMLSTGIFPNMVVQMVAIGEESGAIDAMLSKIADIYEQEVDDAVDGLSALLEPLIMAVLGVLVGGLIIAMYLPIFQLGAVV
ncbi:type II secretion system F family protein [Aliikangiella coralliicola]|uniref:Type II secretion system F family protein n=1 Tax=Aliikangiella coralliicola TaxID=2592383 RepID=A0A545TZY2_9GAMM|nr:type II secretion system F family protein [Aliikangiella coralliicola]TQV82772.1 type II secretion system F family protein [Aliikangiella coralliicola]